ncbi:MAG: hypothetical protein KQJ78_08865 [Deltaproteobacteria bacterium]|nr:hypothetical protein [Deltaproteobacteria bacterium]
MADAPSPRKVWDERAPRPARRAGLAALGLVLGTALFAGLLALLAPAPADRPARAAELADRVELYKWTGWDRWAYRDRQADWSFGFGQLTRPRWVAHYFLNIFDYQNRFDYACIPDDLLVFESPTGGYWFTRATGLNWRLDHGLTADGQGARLVYHFQPGDGFHAVVRQMEALVGEKIDWRPPPAAVTVTHRLTAGRRVIPLRITVRNPGPEPVTGFYVIQDGAWLSSSDHNQKTLHPLWPGPRPGTALRVTTMRHQRRDVAAAWPRTWFGVYDLSNGGMFYGIAADPNEAAVRSFSFSDRPVDLDGAAQAVAGKVRHKLGRVPYEYDGGLGFFMKKGYRLTLAGLDALLAGQKDVNFAAARAKYNVTVLDFGTLAPGQEKTVTVRKILYSGFASEKELLGRVEELVREK